MKKAISIGYIMVLLIATLVVAGNFVHIVSASTEISGIIASDTTWTEANSPYEIVGPTAVNETATLTIEPGVTVNFNDFYLQVNGTLIAIGTSAEKVTFNAGQIIIKPVANGWDDQSGSGCIFENAVINRTSILSDVAVKITKVYANASITVGDSSIISHNLLVDKTIVGDSATITDNTIIYETRSLAIETGNLANITNNNIRGLLSSGSATIVNNTITGTVTIRNTISAGSVISNNTIRGGGSHWYYGLLPMPRYATYPITAIDVAGGLAEISNNTIISLDISDEFNLGLPESNLDGGYGITTQANCDAYIHGNVISNGFVRGINAVGPATIQENLMINNIGGIAIGKVVYDYGILVSTGDVDIRDNILASSQVGVGGTVTNVYFGSVDYGFTPQARIVTIENNVIFGGEKGIDITLDSATQKIQNNTISNNSVAITLTSCPSATINFNNIQNYNQSSIYLTNTAVDINATYNWWGTTDTQTINQTIRDFKNDFNLGTVTFTPFLNETNPNAPEIPPEDIIPDLPTNLLTILIIVSLTATTLIIRKKLLKDRNNFT